MKIAVVIVTYNRIQDLKKTLKAYEAQTVLPDVVLVVDNCSTDGTGEYLDTWSAEKKGFEARVISLPTNQGGSGGFSHGMTEALKTDCDWVFVADDDAVPRRDVFEKLVSFCENNPELAEEAAAICTAVYNRDHNSGIHRCMLKKTPFGMFEAYVPESWYSKDYFEFDIYSFVGTMIKSSALREAGVARKDFFIYNDDYEHAVRVRKCGKLICVPAAVLDHVDNLTYSKDATWRDYYGTRNGIIMHKTHFGSYAAFWRAMRRLAVGISSCNPEKLKVIWTAILDGFHEKTGIHPVYKPGWVPQKRRSGKKQ